MFVVDVLGDAGVAPDAVAGELAVGVAGRDVSGKLCASLSPTYMTPKSEFSGMSGPTRPPGGALGSPVGAPLSRKVVVEFSGWSSAVPAMPSRPSASSAVPAMPSGPQSLALTAPLPPEPSPCDGLVTDERAAAVLVADLPVGGVGAEEAMLTPASRAALKSLNSSSDQYSRVAGDDDDLVLRCSSAAFWLHW